MRALVVDGDVAFAAELSHQLRAFADVETSTDGGEAMAALRARSFDLVVAEWLLPSVDGVSLLRCLRESGSSTPFVMCTVLSQREARDYALAAGATEVLLKPVSADAVASAAIARVTPAGTTASRAPAGDDDLAKFVAKPAWRDVAKTLVRALAQATGKALQETTPATGSTPERYDSRTTLAMVDVRSRVRLELGVFTTIDGGRQLVKDALRVRDPQPEEVTEFLSEMCNQTLGAVKSAMRVGGAHFTLFVPRTRFVQPAAGWAVQFPASRTVQVAGEAGLTMMLVLGARPCVTKTVEIAALRENMVTVDDIHDDAGAVLAESATRLTANILVKIKMRAAEQRVNVAE
jgi:DNA-binding response OmpR family regulator